MESNVIMARATFTGSLRGAVYFVSVTHTYNTHQTHIRTINKHISTFTALGMLCVTMKYSVFDQ